eukprot:6466592-Amphidinium_carterae.1
MAYESVFSGPSVSDGMLALGTTSCDNIAVWPPTTIVSPPQFELAGCVADFVTAPGGHSLTLESVNYASSLLLRPESAVSLEGAHMNAAFYDLWEPVSGVPVVQKWPRPSTKQWLPGGADDDHATIMDLETTELQCVRNCTYVGFESVSISANDHSSTSLQCVRNCEDVDLGLGTMLIYDIKTQSSWQTHSLCYPDQQGTLADYLYGSLFKDHGASQGVAEIIIIDAGPVDVGTIYEDDFEHSMSDVVASIVRPPWVDSWDDTDDISEAMAHGIQCGV